jgi:hypothetical protein
MAAQPLFERCAIAARLLRNCLSIAAQLLSDGCTAAFRRLTIAARLLRNRFSIAAQSLSDRCAITF